MDFIAPSLPVNAPFSPLQRAWLDGFLAGMLGGDGITTPTAPAPASPTKPEAVPAAPEIEDFPWKDPSLPLDERVALAAGRRPARVLMAAMAQTDCGQCGYLCQTYAEAIASGAESSMTRCMPGGKATARKLKELAAELGVPGPASVAPVVLAASAPSAADVSAAPIALGAGERFSARLVEARRLNCDGSNKDTRLIVLETDIGAGGYQVGDSIGVVAHNCPELVGAIIKRLGVAADTPVLSPDGIECPLIAALTENCEIRRPSDQAIEVLASRAHDIDESRVLQAIAEGYPGRDRTTPICWICSKAFRRPGRLYPS